MQVLVNRVRETAILVAVGEKYGTIIPFASDALVPRKISMLSLDPEHASALRSQVRKAPTREAAERLAVQLADLWESIDYPVHRAAAHYLTSTAVMGTKAETINLLKGIVMQYVIDKDGDVVAAAGSKKEANAEFGQLPEDQRIGGAAIVSSAAEMAEWPMARLVKIYNEHAAEDAQVEKFKSKAVGADKAFEVLEAQFNPKVKAAAAKTAEKEAKAAAKAAGKAEKSNGAASPRAKQAPGELRPDTKSFRLNEALADGKAHTLAELVEASGFDEANTKTCIGIFRTRKGMTIAYDKAAATYTKTL